MKYILSMLLLSAIVYSTSIHVDLNLVHQQNTETSSPIIFEPGPVFNEIYNTATDTPILSNTNDNNNPPSSFVIEHNHRNKPNVLLPNPPLF